MNKNVYFKNYLSLVVAILRPDLSAAAEPGPERPEVPWRGPLRSHPATQTPRPGQEPAQARLTAAAARYGRLQRHTPLTGQHQLAAHAAPGGRSTATLPEAGACSPRFQRDSGRARPGRFRPL